MTLELASLRAFAGELAARPEHWREHVRHNSDVRAYTQIWDDEDVNAWLICWTQSQDTGFHDHDRSGAAITVVSGSIVEERLCVGRDVVAQIHSAGETVTVPPSAIHRVRHAGPGPAVSIHAYSPPLERTGAYRIASDGRLEREALGIDYELRPEPARALS